MQVAQEDQIGSGADKVGFTFIKNQQRIGSAGLFNAVTARKYAFPFQNHYKKRRTWRIMLTDDLPGQQREKNRTALAVGMRFLI